MYRKIIYKERGKERLYDKDKKKVYFVGVWNTKIFTTWNVCKGFVTVDYETLYIRQYAQIV